VELGKYADSFGQCSSTGSRSQQQGGGDFVVLPFFVAANLQNSNCFILQQVQKKFEPTEGRILVLSPKKIATKLSEIWVGDPGSGKINPGSRGKTSTGPRIRNLVIAQSKLAESRQ
jgi:hypothetical protein